MANEAVRVEGLNELIRNFRKVNADYPKEAKNLHLELAKPVAETARTKVRSRSGRLANSIRPSGTQKLARVSAGARLVYGGVNHYGWPARNITGNPFLTDALREHNRDIAKNYEKLMGEFIEKVWIDYHT